MLSVHETWVMNTLFSAVKTGEGQGLVHSGICPQFQGCALASDFPPHPGPPSLIPALCAPSLAIFTFAPVLSSVPRNGLAPWPLDPLIKSNPSGHGRPTSNDGGGEEAVGTGGRASEPSRRAALDFVSLGLWVEQPELVISHQLGPGTS